MPGAASGTDHGSSIHQAPPPAGSSDAVGSRGRYSAAGIVFALGDLASYLIASPLLFRSALHMETAFQALALCVALLTVLYLHGAAIYPGRGVAGHEVLRRRVIAASQVGVVAVASTAALAGITHAAGLAAFLVVALLLQPPIRMGLEKLPRMASIRSERESTTPGVGAKVSLGRALDVPLAAAALICASPLLAVAALAILIVDPGPVLFRQARVGLGGKTIRIFKLRTMYRDADERLEKLLAESPEARHEWNTHFKLRHDPRVLPYVGAILRSTSCDELPQLVNVILGDMRLVGPRPFPRYHLAALPTDFQQRRCSITPGVTGLCQVTYRGNADIQLQQRLDEFYIANRSPWLDLHILLMTVTAVLGRRGAF
ncbi:MAG: sugar transferase [Amaricoccus sp.]|uniref:sugar transferase n=1 Tax=Amaricoccus sp. TaxID=1872485 RepID=UPI003314FCFA